jgi:LacI family transcriptional regulator
MGRIKNHVTIQDIARELHLSRNTVSKALKNSKDVSNETKQLVVTKAFEMGYSKLSPALLKQFNVEKKSNQNKSIVVLARRESSIFWGNIIMGISEEINKYESKLQVNFISEYDEKNLILPVNFQDKIEGIIFLNVFSKKYIDEIMKYNTDTAVVFLDAPNDVYSIADYGDIVILEGVNSVKTITKHLIEQGMRKIGFIGDITYCKTIYDRYQGFLNAMNSAGLELDESIIAVYHPSKRFYDASEIEAALKKFPYLPEALVCANDDIALNVVKYLKKQGISVPDDVAVTGYDNLESMMHVVEPFLTTVGFSKHMLGRRLVQQLMWRMRNPEFPKEVVYIGVDIIFRRSSQRVLLKARN